MKTHSNIVSKDEYFAGFEDKKKGILVLKKKKLEILSKINKVGLKLEC